MAKRRIYLLVLALCAGVLYFFENSPATLAILASVIILPLLSAALCALVKSGISCYVNLPEEAKKDETFKLEMGASGGVLARILVLNCRVDIENTLTGERSFREFSITPDAKENFTLVSRHCGTLKLEVSVRVSDLFGIYEGGTVSSHQAFILIKPKLFEINVTLAEGTTAAGDGDTYSSDKAGFDPSETFGIREYVPGDPIKQIHWKLSQKTDKLMLRQLGLPVVTNTLIAFEGGFCSMQDESRADTLDSMAEIFLSLSHALLSSGTPHTVLWNGKRTEIKTDEDYTGMCAGFFESAADLFVSPISYENYEPLDYAHFVVVSSNAAPNAEMLTSKGRVTVISPSTLGIPGVHIYSFTDESFENELSSIVI